MRWEHKTVERGKDIPPGWEPYGYTFERIAVRRKIRWWNRLLSKIFK